MSNQQSCQKEQQREQEPTPNPSQEGNRE
ncbi:hypothetical protein LYNGBM3L_04110 [Moorena producens 3L]|uniref:Uncharacterized protein n=1 Tax=Moorena producens 3L TaxID=489825 RepID=F4XIZ0_9CYAN|nr:hypothetical protein LYNGBM3L_04110 [Moorena producens 3L]